MLAWQIESAAPPGTVCTDSARAVVERVGGQVIGFLRADNPRALVAAVEDGHDFAIVDARFLVDPWAFHVEGSIEKAVFDLHDPSDRQSVAAAYGNAAALRELPDNVTRLWPHAR